MGTARSIDMDTARSNDIGKARSSVMETARSIDMGIARSIVNIVIMEYLCAECMCTEYQKHDEPEHEIPRVGN